MFNSDSSMQTMFFVIREQDSSVGMFPQNAHAIRWVTYLYISYLWHKICIY
jgi:hypothetical protein